jgi:hypothetical protein
MKYQIKIEGGFAGISKEYNGELHFSPDERKAILKSFQHPVKSNEARMRDGFIYSISLHDGETWHTANFDEANLPNGMREVLARIYKNS